MNPTDNRSLDKAVKLGRCEAGMCSGTAIAEIALDTLEFDPHTLASRAVPKSVKVCMPHKSLYFKYQEKMLDRINPERKKYGKNQKGAKNPWAKTHVGYSESFASRFRSLSI